MSYCGKYRVIRMLGRGGFGKVYLVNDQNGNQFAIKQINKQAMNKDDISYIHNEISVMKKFNSQYILKIYNSIEDNKNIYIILQYCNLGDLKKEMALQPEKVYSLQDALEIGSDIIRGLEEVHSKNILHRDIKIENILVKKSNGKKIFLIGDFGLSKAQSHGQTTLGTPSYMSPQILKQVEYGFQVDMWAFGILFYFLINREFPFRRNPYAEDLDSQYNQLVGQAKNFSYSQKVKGSKLKRMENCTPQVEDLFSKIFNLDPNKRITFSEIRKHPLFQKYFPDQINQSSEIMYKKKPKLQKPVVVSKPDVIPQLDQQNVSVRESSIKPFSNNDKFSREKELLYNLNSRLEFLFQNYKQFNQVHGIFNLVEKMALCYNILKYYIILKKQFIESIDNCSISSHYPKFNLKQALKSGGFYKIYEQFSQQLLQAQQIFQIFHIECADSLQFILKVNPNFKQSFNQKIIQTEFADPFRSTYRKSTLYSFNKVRGLLKENIKGNKCNYFLALIVISHVFNRFFSDKEKVQAVFNEFFKQKQKSSDDFDYEQLRQWMSKSTPNQLNNVTKKIIKIYFENG